MSLETFIAFIVATFIGVGVSFLVYNALKKRFYGPSSDGVADPTPPEQHDRQDTRAE